MSAYGHVAIIERNAPNPTNPFSPNVERLTLRRKGSERVVQRAARLVSGFLRVVSVEPYTRDEWLGVFGSGRS